MMKLRAAIEGRVNEDRHFYRVNQKFDACVKEYRAELLCSSGILKSDGTITIDRVSIGSAELMLRRSLETDRMRMFREMEDVEEEEV